MSAGSDTTAATIRCTMLYLMTNPRVYHKLKQMVREAVAEGRVSSPIKHDEAKQFPYLQVRINGEPQTVASKTALFTFGT